MTKPRAKTVTETALVAGAALLFGFAFCHQLFGRWTEPGEAFDWDFFLELHWVPYHELLRFHQLPLWNPYKCGGMPMLGNPQSRILTPFFLLHLLVGPVAGLHLEIPLHVAIAWAGGYVLARVMGLSYLAAIALGSIFPAGSWFYLHVSEGHAVFLPAAYFPWVLVLAYRAIESRRLTPAAAAGALTALVFGEGGIYPTTQILLVVGVLALAVTCIQRSAWPLVVILTAGVFTIGFAAIKLLPAAHTVLLHPRPWDASEYNSPATMATAFFSRDQDNWRPWWGMWAYHEYGCYLSLFPILAGLSLGGWRRRGLWPWLLITTILLLLICGDFGPWSPWVMLHRMPIFSSERIPSRFVMPFALAVAALAAYGVDFLSRRRIGRAAAVLLLIVGVADSWWVDSRGMANMFGWDEPAVPYSRTFRQFQGPTNHMFPIAQANLGAVNCYEYTYFTTEAMGDNQVGYRGEQYLLGPGQVRLVRWTPNILTYDVDAWGAAVLVVNQNYDTGWRMRSGTGDLKPLQGLLSVQVPRGRQRIELVFEGNGFRLGALITFLTGLLAIVLRLTEGPPLALAEPLAATPQSRCDADQLTDLWAACSYLRARYEAGSRRMAAARAHRPLSVEIAAIGVLSLTFAAMFCYPLFGHLGQAGLLFDWDRFLEQHWTIYRTVVRYHQFPFWTPYKCGGMPLLANPESRILSPFFPVDLLMGPVAGPHLEIPLHLAIAFAGAYVLARVQGIGALASMAGGLVFAGSSWFFLHIAAGHVVFLPFAYLPWILAALWTACERRRPGFAIVAGMLIAVALGEGGVHPVTFAVMTAALMAAAVAVRQRSALPVVLWFLMLLFGALLAAPKLLPALAMITQRPRPSLGNELYSPLTLLSAMLSRHQDIFRPTYASHSERWGFHEYGAYVGMPALLLIGAGLLRRLRNCAVWLTTGAALFLLALGNFGLLSPWALIHRLPILSSEMVAPRALIPLTLCLAMIGAWGAQYLFEQPRLRWVGGLALILALGDNWLIGPPNLAHIFEDPASSGAAAGSFRQYRSRNMESMLLANWANMGAATCYDYTFIPINVTGYNQAGYHGEYQILGQGDLQLVRWTPNALTFAVHSASPSILVINQNYDPSWTLSEGAGQIVPYHGLLAVKLPAGRQRLRLAYRSAQFAAGLGTAAAALILAIGMVSVARRQARRLGGGGNYSDLKERTGAG